MSLLEIEFFGKTEIIAWLLMTIAKDQATHSVLLILQISSMSNIYSMNDLTCHNSDKDGDQNIDLHVTNSIAMLAFSILMLNWNRGS
jgi:hypothetical protein